jgi:hypothetical protein
MTPRVVRHDLVSAEARWLDDAHGRYVSLLPSLPLRGAYKSQMSPHTSRPLPLETHMRGTCPRIPHSSPSKQASLEGLVYPYVCDGGPHLAQSWCRPMPIPLEVSPIAISPCSLFPSSPSIFCRSVIIPVNLTFLRQIPLYRP